MTVFEYIRSQRTSYENEELPIVDGYDYSQYKTLRRIELYWASEYERDAYDPVIGKLPFDNIVKDKALKEAQATDFDTKDVDIRPAKPTPESRYKNMIATKAVRKWMDDNQFGIFLNDLCLTRAKYGGVMVKNTDDGAKVVPWHNLITDQSDIMSGIIIERHYFTPSELLKQTQWDHLNEVVLLAEEAKDSDTDGDQEKDTQGHYIEIYEVHGELPEDMIKEDGDPMKFVQVMMVVAGVDHTTTDSNGVEHEHGIILFQEEESESPYKYLARNPVAGRGLGVGIVEDLFEHQKWHNFNLSEEYRVMAQAGKIMYITDDPDIPNNIQEAEIDHGTVLRKRPETNFSQIAAVPTNLPQYSNIRAELGQSARNITGVHESVSGEATKSGTPFRLAALQNVEGHARFEQYREEIGFFVEEIIKDWVLPAAMKAIRSKDEIYTHFEDTELLEIDRIIKQKALTARFTEMTLEGQVITPERFAEMEAEVDRELALNGSKRLIQGLKDFLKDIDGEIRIITTNESLDRAGFFESRANFLQLLAPEDPRRNALIDKMMDEAGITPEELQLKQDQAVVTQQADVEFTSQDRQAPAEELV